MANQTPPSPKTKLKTAPTSLVSSPSCFVDGAWQASPLNADMGWQINGSQGNRLSQGSENRRFVGSALVADALAMKAALKQAYTLGLY